MTEEKHAIERASKVGIGWGIAVVLLGVLAICAPFVSGLAVTTIVAACLVAAGIVQVVFAFQAGSFGRGLLAFLFGAISVAAGVLIFMHPLFGLEAITIMLIAYFLVDGVYHFAAAAQLKAHSGRGWLVFGGIVSILLAGVIWFAWPDSGAWALGLVVGVRLLLTGWMMIVFGSAARAALRNGTETPAQP